MTLVKYISCTLDCSDSSVVGPWTTAIACLLPSVLLSPDMVAFILIIIIAFILALVTSAMVMSIVVTVVSTFLLGLLIILQLLIRLIANQIQRADNVLVVHRRRDTKLCTDLLQELSMCLGGSWGAELLDGIDQPSTVGHR